MYVHVCMTEVSTVQRDYHVDTYQTTGTHPFNHSTVHSLIHWTILQGFIWVIDLIRFDLIDFALLRRMPC